MYPIQSKMLARNFLKQFIVCVVQIFRIQNPSMYLQYMVRRDAMQRQQAAASKTPVERILWHGTAFDAVESVNKTGFNRSYCGKNGMSETCTFWCCCSEL